MDEVNVTQENYFAENGHLLLHAEGCSMQIKLLSDFEMRNIDFK